MSDESMRDTVAEEAAEQIDVAKLIGDGLQEGVNGEEMGIAIGRWTGRRLGRSAGETVGATIHEILASGPEHRSVREIASDAKEEAISSISEHTDEGLEKIEEGQERVEEGEERIKEEAGKVADDLPSLEDINRETLDEMSDQDLESIAQEVGVKADQAREEMSTKILEAAPGHEEEGNDGNAGQPRDL